MSESSHVTFEKDGCLYSRTYSMGVRPIFRIIGGLCVVSGAAILLSEPVSGLIFIALGIFLFRKRSRLQKTEFLSIAGPSLAGCNTFGDWDPKVHQGTAQSDRFEKSIHEPLSLVSYDGKLGVATISGSSGTPYTVTLDYCSCPDFEKRSKPCKHIYFLAGQMGYTSDDFYDVN